MEAEWIKLFPITSSTVFMIPHYLIFSGERNPISSNSLLCDKILNLLHHPYHSFPRSASFPSCLPLNIKPLCVCMLSCVWLFATSWTVAHQAPLTMGFSRQEYWSWLPCPPPEDLHNLRVESGLQHRRQILDLLSHPGSPRLLEWVAYPFSRGTSWPRNQTRVSYIASRFFTT